MKVARIMQKEILLKLYSVHTGMDRELERSGRDWGWDDRSGLVPGESESQVMEDKQLSFTVTPRARHQGQMSRWVWRGLRGGGGSR